MKYIRMMSNILCLCFWGRRRTRSWWQWSKESIREPWYLDSSGRRVGQRPIQICWLDLHIDFSSCSYFCFCLRWGVQVSGSDVCSCWFCCLGCVSIPRFLSFWLVPDPRFDSWPRRCIHLLLLAIWLDSTWSIFLDLFMSSQDVLSSSCLLWFQFPSVWWSISTMKSGYLSMHFHLQVPWFCSPAAWFSTSWFSWDLPVTK